MTRLEKCEWLKFKGYKYDPDTGKIYGSKGNELKGKSTEGYIVINRRSFNGELKGHHFAYYMVYGNVDFDLLDHINLDKTDNRISNLRIVTSQQNRFNTKAKGCSYHKGNKKWCAEIMLNYKKISLGYFNTEEEARNAYLEAKKKYHKIKNPL